MWSITVWHCSAAALGYLIAAGLCLALSRQNYPEPVILAEPAGVDD